MPKPLIKTLYVLTLITSGFTIKQVFAERGPAVEPITEVSIEDNRPARAPGQVETGFDFRRETQSAIRKAPVHIASKTKKDTNSFAGPFIFLCALPIALWIVISKKMKQQTALKKVDYYPKTFQFRPYKSDYQDHDVDDDQDFPKAS